MAVYHKRTGAASTLARVVAPGGQGVDALLPFGLEDDTGRTAPEIGPGGAIMGWPAWWLGVWPVWNLGQMLVVGSASDGLHAEMRTSTLCRAWSSPEKNGSAPSFGMTVSLSRVTRWGCQVPSNRRTHEGSRPEAGICGLNRQIEQHSTLGVSPLRDAMPCATVDVTAASLRAV
ncbi:unnamed protein product [Ostreobium quekettii]|uniref:Uncharacterized protein n=1 Tax=Ostreobium quekettii TaxID=121088 RepID=A0A8S1JBV7_9CHLO|nr:unnamed protein product [Ostreobium quekettii]